MTVEIDSYRRRKRGKLSWSPHTTDEDAFVKETLGLLKVASKPYSISIAHKQYGPDRSLSFIAQRLPKLLASEAPGTSIVIACDRLHGGPEFAVQRIQTALKPADTEGSPAIDLIHAAVVAEFGPRNWGLFSVGIYVNKPGEHGAIGPGWRGNAEDFEFADSFRDDAESDGKLDELGKFLVAEQAKGLPVGGVISQGASWQPPQPASIWHPYDVGADRFTRHYTHVHASGAPEQVPGWI